MTFYNKCEKDIRLQKCNFINSISYWEKPHSYICKCFANGAENWAFFWILIVFIQACYKALTKVLYKKKRTKESFTCNEVASSHYQWAWCLAMWPTTRRTLVVSLTVLWNFFKGSVSELCAEWPGTSYILGLA